MLKRVLRLIIMLGITSVAVNPSRSMGIAQPRAALRDDPQPMTVRGEISDSTCAGAGSHGTMMAKLHAKDVKECTLACVKAGAQFVLYNSDDKTIYRLDSQDSVKQYAGQTVTVIGQYDRASGILHVDRVETGM